MKADKFRKIGVFDSGAGGLSVLKSLLKSDRFSEIIYYGDTARVPYGVKSRQTIEQYAQDAVDFFAPFEIDLLIVACNTVSAYGLPTMRKSALYPVVGVIRPGVLACENKLNNKEAEILVLGTKATIKSGLYERLLRDRGFCNIRSISPSLFVPLVEENIFSGDLLESAMAHYFSPLLSSPDAIILGCTHFPLIANAIQSYFFNKFAAKPLLVHSGEAIIEYLSSPYFSEFIESGFKSNLDSMKISKNVNFKDFIDINSEDERDILNFPTATKLRFFASDAVAALKNTARIWLNA